MDFTVYTMGDMPIFVSVLNAMTAVFNSSMFDPAQGAGVYVVSIMLGILIMALSFITSGKFSGTPVILGFVIFFGGIVPRANLQVEDIYSGQIAVVANVPIVIALPGTIAATLSNAITTTVETAFSTVSGNYLSLGSEGFANPLRTLLKLRDPVLIASNFPYISASLREFVTFCAPTDLAFSTRTMTQSSDVIAYLTGLSVNGVMTYWNAANPQGFGTSCTQGQKNLTSDLSFTPGDGSPTDAALTRVLKMPTDGNYSQNPNSQSATTTGVGNAYNAVTGMMLTNGQNSQQFMTNMIAYMPLTSGVNCLNNPTGSEMSACLGGVMQRQAMEQQQIDSAASASMFSRVAIPAMNILLALFYGFSPIILAIALFSGAHAIRIMGGFLLFGAWTQSWMPIAAVINYMIQLQVQYGFSGMPSTGVTLDAYNPFYTALAMKIGFASTMLASTPMITLALLSGSVYGLTSLASSTSGKDYVDPNLASPSLGKVDEVAHVGPSKSMHGTSIDRNSGIETNGVYQPQVNVSAGTDLSRQNQTIATDTFSQMHTDAAAAKKMVADKIGHTGTTADQHAAGVAAIKSITDKETFLNKAAHTVQQDSSFSDAQKASFTASLKLALPEMLSVGASSTFERAISDLKKDGKSHESLSGIGQDYANQVSKNESTQKSYTAAGVKGSELVSSQELATQESQVAQELAAISQMESAAARTSAGENINSNEMAANYRLNNGTSDQLFADAGFDSNDAAYNNALNRIAASNGGSPPNEQNKINAILMAQHAKGKNLAYFGAQHGMFYASNAAVQRGGDHAKELSGLDNGDKLAVANAKATAAEHTAGNVSVSGTPLINTQKMRKEEAVLTHFGKTIGDFAGSYSDSRKADDYDSHHFTGGMVKTGDLYARQGADHKYYVQEATEPTMGDAVPARSEIAFQNANDKTATYGIAHGRHTIQADSKPLQADANKLLEQPVPRSLTESIVQSAGGAEHVLPKAMAPALHKFAPVISTAAEFLGPEANKIKSELSAGFLKATDEYAKNMIEDKPKPPTSDHSK